MNYPRMSLFSGCKELTHHAICASAPQTTDKPGGMREHRTLLAFLQPHLKNWVTTKVGSCLCFRLHICSWHPPRDTNNCDAWRMLMSGGTYIHWLAAPSKPRCTRALTKREEWVALPGFSGILRHVWQETHAQQKHKLTHQKHLMK